MKHEMKKKKSMVHSIWLLALAPLFFIGWLLLLMVLGFAEGVSAVGVISLLLASILWGFAGALFSKTRTTLGVSLFVANVIPILSTILYSILRVVTVLFEREAFAEPAELIGGLGMGVFTLFSSILYAIIPLDLYEVYMNLIFMLLVFLIGYATGYAFREKKTQSGDQHKIR